MSVFNVSCSAFCLTYCFGTAVNVHLSLIGPAHTDNYCSAQCFLARDVIYISRLCYDVSVSLSVRLFVTEVHWRIIANSGFKFRSKFTAQPTMRPHALRVAVHAGALWSRCMPGRGEWSSRAMLATAMPSCTILLNVVLLCCKQINKSA